jgi:hypothetical protein
MKKGSPTTASPPACSPAEPPTPQAGSDFERAADGATTGACVPGRAGRGACGSPSARRTSHARSTGATCPGRGATERLAAARTRRQDGSRNTRHQRGCTRSDWRRHCGPARSSCDLLRAQRRRDASVLDVGDVNVCGLNSRSSTPSCSASRTRPPARVAPRRVTPLRRSEHMRRAWSRRTPLRVVLNLSP